MAWFSLERWAGWGSVQGVETAYLALLIATFVVIGVVSVYILIKLFAGQR